jgi:hypothetical protein
LTVKRRAAVAGAIVLTGALVAFAVGRDEPKSAMRASGAGDAGGEAGRATVTVYDEGRPVAGRWVVFHDATGAVTSFAKSGADGRVSGAVTRGSMVTVADGTSLRKLLTIQAVEPNDELVVGEVEEEEGAAKTQCRALVSIPSAHPLAKKHVVSLGVGRTEIPDPNKPLPMPVLRRFIVDGKFPVLAEALDADGKAVAFSFERPACGDAGNVDVRLPPWSTDFQPFTLVVKSARVGKAPPSIVAELSVVSGEDRFDRGRQEATMRQGTTFRFDTPRALGSKVIYKVAVAHPGAQDRSVLVERRDDMPAQVELDLRATLMPRVETAILEPGSAAARPAVRWSLSGAGPKADAAVVRLAWPSTREHVWTILAAPDAPTRVVAPVLPDELADFRPTGREITVAAAIVEASFLDGYRDMRKNGLTLLDDPPHAPSVTVRYSALGDLDF